MRLGEIRELMEQAPSYSVNDMHFDLTDDGVLNYWNNTPAIQYPSIVIECGDNMQTDEETATMTYNFRVYIGDRRRESDNNDWATWDNLAIQLQYFVQRLNNLFTDGTRAEESLIFTPTTQVFADNLAVVQTNIKIVTPLNLNACNFGEW